MSFKQLDWQQHIFVQELTSQILEFGEESHQHPFPDEHEEMFIDQSKLYAYENRHGTKNKPMNLVHCRGGHSFSLHLQ